MKTAVRKDIAQAEPPEAEHAWRIRHSARSAPDFPLGKSIKNTLPLNQEFPLTEVASMENGKLYKYTETTKSFRKGKKKITNSLY
jgi:hypothetical protein